MGSAHGSAHGHGFSARRASPSPTVSSISRSIFGKDGDVVPWVLKGTNLTGGTVKVNGVAVASQGGGVGDGATQITINQGPALPRGEYNVTVTTSAATSSPFAGYYAGPFFCWFDARYLTVQPLVGSGEKVSGRGDVSGAGNSGSQVSAGNQPRLYTSGGNLVNGLAAIKYDGIVVEHDWINLPDMSALTAAKMYVLGIVDNATNVGWSRIGASVVSAQFPFADRHVYESFGSSSRPDTGIPPISLTAAPWLYEAMAAAGRLTTWFNSTLQYDAAATVQFSSSPRFGCSASNTLGWSGRDQSIMILSDAPTANEDAAIRAYLKGLGGIA